MSTRNVMSAVSTAFSFTSDKVTENILNFTRSENIELSDAQMRRMASIIKGTVEQSLSLTADSIEKATLNK